MELELPDRKLLNRIQSDFPLAERPFQSLGQELGLSEEEVIQRVRDLKKAHIIRQISAIFDTRHLGYQSTLVAMRFPPEKLAQGAEVINRHPGVSHNYARTHYYNLWFTLAVPPEEGLEDTVARLAREAGAEATRILPTLRFFKIGVNLDMVSGETTSGSPLCERQAPGGPDGKVELTERDIQAIRELQEDLPLVPRPFLGMASRLGISEQGLFDLARGFLEHGLMRRYSAVLHHREAGFKCNAMVCWRVPPERAEEVGRILASHPMVSHCYQRPTYPDWPYSHFSMLHAATRERCLQAIKELGEKTVVKDYAVLYSTKEYKKTRVRYFV